MNNEKKTSEKKGFKGFFKARSTRRGAAAIALTALVIAAVVLVNLVLAAVTNTHPLYIDVTENSSFKLQPETEEFASSINKDVTVYILQTESNFESGDSTNYRYFIQANKLVHAIVNCSDHIDLHYVDLTSNPTFTKDYPNINWTESHIALVVSGDNYRAIDATDMFSYDEQQYQYYGTYVINGQHVEQSIMTAIMNVTAENKTKVTLLSGQGEQEMTAFTKLLENNAFEVETVSLLNGKISADSEFVIIYDPEVDIDSDTYKKLTDWLNNGDQYGHNLFYFPNDQHDLSDYPNLNALIADYGMELRNGYIYENANDHLIPGYNHYISIMDYADEDQTFKKELRSTKIPVVMSLTMPVNITDDTVATPLLTSTDKAIFFPKDLTEEEAEKFDPKAEKLNGVAIGKRNDGTTDGKSSSVVVIGSYDAMTSSYISSPAYNNAAYFVNLFNTLCERENVSIVIEGKNPASNSLGLTSVNDIVFPSILVRYIIPIAVLLAGIVIWIRRRFR
ncbi:Gldg family protein [uncultured Ruminococcus sp.]|uniref:Gldg family protein n=1 Tax=uncultured Ruminococcus sp. TaxID=165186 RepID=UPI00292EE393|nr:Gldg family protein [uncultured Ruminococcus sp.]